MCSRSKGYCKLKKKQLRRYGVEREENGRGREGGREGRKGREEGKGG
jgi:hypothetical protein